MSVFLHLVSTQDDPSWRSASRITPPFFEWSRKDSHWGRGGPSSLLLVVAIRNPPLFEWSRKDGPSRLLLVVAIRNRSSLPREICINIFFYFIIGVVCNVAIYDLDTQYPYYSQIDKIWG